MKCSRYYIVVDESTIGCACGWKKEIDYTGTDKKFLAYHRNHKRAVYQKALRRVYADMGMKRVRGALGGVYYE
jgi:hypothetical protein